MPIAKQIIEKANKDPGTVDFETSYNCLEKPILFSSRANEIIPKNMKKASKITPNKMNNLQNKPVLKL